MICETIDQQIIFVFGSIAFFKGLMESSAGFIISLFLLLLLLLLFDKNKKLKSILLFPKKKYNQNLLLNQKFRFICNFILQIPSYMTRTEFFTIRVVVFVITRSFHSFLSWRIQESLRVRIIKTVITFLLQQGLFFVRVIFHVFPQTARICIFFQTTIHLTSVRFLSKNLFQKKKSNTNRNTYGIKMGPLVFRPIRTVRETFRTSGKLAQIRPFSRMASLVYL